ncbi:MAG: c-type cytochrome [Thiothrix sp.]|uniref:c-type cytochrome n=1 Tax=Thiothrix sp. TaxID=1032 RepID=UPI002630976B|nr:c-type cytochrome [Thiothrix sp.]MDD5395462.1 c-type cytochrome [Thiothrix sp.]
MKRYQVRTISIVLCLSMMVFANAGFAKEPLKKERNRSHIEIDPTNTGTYTGDAGKDNFIANCSPCHGDTGKGDGPLAETLGEGVRPRNLSDGKFLSVRSDEFLFKVIKSGGVSVGLSESMPSWKETFTDAEIKQIIQYVRNSICKCKYKDK